MAVAMPEGTVKNLTIIGAGFGSGIIEAAAYRANPALGTIVTFGGALAGLGLALWGRGMLADVGTGVAASSAGSLGHYAIRTVWPGRKQLPSGNGKTSPREMIGAKGNPGNPGVSQEVMNEEVLV